MKIIIANGEYEELFLLSPCSESYVIDKSDLPATTDTPASDDNSDEEAA